MRIIMHEPSDTVEMSLDRWHLAFSVINISSFGQCDSVRGFPWAHRYSGPVPAVALHRLPVSSPSVDWTDRHSLERGAVIISENCPNQSHGITVLVHLNLQGQQSVSGLVHWDIWPITLQPAGEIWTVYWSKAFTCSQGKYKFISMYDSISFIHQGSL